LIQKNWSVIEVAYENGPTYELLSIGATLTKWISRDGTNLVAGYEDYLDYSKGGMYLGTCVGLISGRIASATCKIEGSEYHFNSKEKHYLHGGDKGLSFQNFEVSSITENDDKVTIEFSTQMVPEEIGGLVSVKIAYELRNDGFRIDFFAKTSKTTLCNLTNHSYFNLDGDFLLDLSHHSLELNASKAVMVDDEILGTEIIDVNNTVFDFRNAKSLMPSIMNPLLKSQKANGFDHFFLLDNHIKPAVVLYSSKSNRRLNIKTDYPGVTIYTTNYPNKKRIHNSYPLSLHSAIAIEPQYQSNAINDDRFEGYLLKPNQNYHHFIDYCLWEDKQ
jgi:aldose 1-epimerase